MLNSIMRACVGVFTGLMVESSISMINHILGLHSGRTEIELYSAIMTIKYQLKSAGVAASSSFTERTF